MFHSLPEYSLCFGVPYFSAFFGVLGSYYGYLYLRSMYFFFSVYSKVGPYNAGPLPTKFESTYQNPPTPTQRLTPRPPQPNTPTRAARRPTSNTKEGPRHNARAPAEKPGSNIPKPLVPENGRGLRGLDLYKTYNSYLHTAIY